MNFEEILREIEAEIRPHVGEGAVADYIPALAEVDINSFAMSVIMLDGQHYGVGDCEQPFSIQSISKIFSLTVALGYEDADLWKRVGREPSGTAFNSIVQLERENGVPRNPFINAGALVVTDSIISHCKGDDPLPHILDLVRRASGGTTVKINQRVAASEKEWGDRNRSLAYFMKSFDVLENDPESVLDAYFNQCAIEMTTFALARAGLFLANDGVDPVTGEKITTHARVNRINALMLTCGHYDMSGDFAFRVGLPGKSGVGGGILAIVPGVCSIAVWSPGLNKYGSSHAGTLALETLSEKTQLNLF